MPCCTRTAGDIPKASESKRELPHLNTPQLPHCAKTTIKDVLDEQRRTREGCGTHQSAGDQVLHRQKARELRDGCQGRQPDVHVHGGLAPSTMRENGHKCTLLTPRKLGLEVVGGDSITYRQGQASTLAYVKPVEATKFCRRCVSGRHRNALVVRVPEPCYPRSQGQIPCGC
eukprot:UN0355